MNKVTNCLLALACIGAAVALNGCQPASDTPPSSSTTVVKDNTPTPAPNVTVTPPASTPNVTVNTPPSTSTHTETHTVTPPTTGGSSTTTTSTGSTG